MLDILKAIQTILKDEYPDADVIIGEPDTLTAFPTIELHALNDTPERLTLRGLTEHRFIEIVIAIESPTETEAYEEMLTMTEEIKDTLFLTYRPVIPGGRYIYDSQVVNVQYGTVKKANATHKASVITYALKEQRFLVQGEYL